MASASFTWTLTAYQQQGRLWLKWSTTAPFRAQQGQISVYKSTSFPSKPQDNRQAWKWDDFGNTPWDTGLTWGSDWYCAYIAEKSPNGPYTYVTQLVTQGATNPTLDTAE